MTGRQGWTLATLGVIAAIAIGVVIAWMTLPADRPKPQATATTVRIDPAPAATLAVKSTDTPIPTAAAIHRLPLTRSRPAGPPATADADPTVITTINSW